MGLTRYRLWRCAACHRVWFGQWGHGELRPYWGCGMVNELETVGNRLVESDTHKTLTPADPEMIRLLTYLILYADDLPDATDTWGILNRATTMCTGKVSLWADRAALSVRRLGGEWPHLQLLAYAYAYPNLVDEVTTALERVPPLARLG